MDPQPTDFYEILSEADKYQTFLRAVYPSLLEPTQPTAPIDNNYSPAPSSPVSVVNHQQGFTEPQFLTALERNQRLKEKQRLQSPPPNGHSATKDALPQIIHKSSGPQRFSPRILQKLHLVTTVAQMDLLAQISSNKNHHRNPNTLLDPNAKYMIAKITSVTATLVKSSI